MFFDFWLEKSDQSQIICWATNKKSLLILHALPWLGSGWNCFSWKAPNRLSLVVKGNLRIPEKGAFHKSFTAVTFFFPHQGEDHLFRLLHVCTICLAMVKQSLYFINFIIQSKVEWTACIFWQSQTVWLLSMNECVYSLCKELYSPVIEMLLRTINQRVPPPGFLLSVSRVQILQGSYCSRDLFCSVLT